MTSVNYVLVNIEYGDKIIRWRVVKQLHSRGWHLLDQVTFGLTLFSKLENHKIALYHLELDVNVKPSEITYTEWILN